MRALGGDQRDREDGQQVGHRDRRVGRLRDEHRGQRDVDRERVEVERVAGGDHEADGGVAHAHALELGHDLRQHAVRRSGRQHHHQLLAQVLEELPQAEPAQLEDAAEHDADEDHHRQVEQRHQHAELLQRAEAVLADRERDGAEHAQRRQLDEDAHDLEQHVREILDQVGYVLAAITGHRQCAAEQHREQQHLQHVAGGEGIDHRRRDQLHQELDSAAAGELARVLGVGAHRLGIQRLRVDVHADARLEQEGQRQAEGQRDGSHQLEVDERLHANAADALQVAGAGDAVHDDAEDDQRNDHLDQLDEAVAQRLELHRRLRHEKAEQHAGHEGHQYLAEQGTQESRHHGLQKSL